MIGTLDDLQARVHLEDVNWVKLAEPTEPIRTLARIRYRAELVPATVYAEPGRKRAVVFDEPQRAVTPGQAVVFYDGEYVVGGGTIDRGRRRGVVRSRPAADQKRGGAVRIELDMLGAPAGRAAVALAPSAATILARSRRSWPTCGP